MEIAHSFALHHLATSLENDRLFNYILKIVEYSVSGFFNQDESKIISFREKRFFLDASFLN
jgi:hypothetical protein